MTEVKIDSIGTRRHVNLDSVPDNSIRKLHKVLITIEDSQINDPYEVVESISYLVNNTYLWSMDSNAIRVSDKVNLGLCCIKMMRSSTSRLLEITLDFSIIGWIYLGFADKNQIYIDLCQKFSNASCHAMIECTPVTISKGDQIEFPMCELITTTPDHSCCGGDINVVFDTTTDEVYFITKCGRCKKWGDCPCGNNISIQLDRTDLYEWKIRVIGSGYFDEIYMISKIHKTLVHIEQNRIIFAK